MFSMFGDSPRAILLVGAPASGKTTWRNSYRENGARETVVISTDDMIDAYADELGITYSDAFGRVNHKAFEKTAFALMEAAVAERRDVVVDRTNMTRKSRRRFLSNVPSFYTKIAVVFELPRDVLDERLRHRAQTTGKQIGSFVVDGMLQRYEAPETDEFDLVVPHVPSTSREPKES